MTAVMASDGSCNFCIALLYGLVLSHGCLEHIELPAELLDYFLRNNKSNINQSVHMYGSCKKDSAAQCRVPTNFAANMFLNRKSPLRNCILFASIRKVHMPRLIDDCFYYLTLFETVI